jgi:hypothetical protein
VAKFGFISGLDEAPKKKYQLFEVEMGFERAQVLVPFDKADEFEKEALEKKPKSKISIGKLAERFGGFVD